VLDVGGCGVALIEEEPFPSLADSVRAGGGVLVDPEAAEAVVWTVLGGVDRLAALLAANPGIRWVQLPMAGVERFLPLIDAGRQWTSGKGLYDEPVAELALALLLAGQRGLATYARARRWSEPQGRGLFAARLAVLGGGGITGALLRLLQPFEADVTVVRRRPRPMPGVRRVVGPERLGEALTGVDGVVVALALTPETEGIIAAGELEAMGSAAFLVNVARGRHVVTDDLVRALEEGVIAGAGLDVTDPEPLPEGHPLWSLPNCLITPHVAGYGPAAMAALAARVSENVRRFCAGESLLGLVDAELGY
jgi:phosphoglycerate dehydrogenase-like enzyme